MYNVCVHSMCVYIHKCGMLRGQKGVEPCDGRLSLRDAFQRPWLLEPRDSLMRKVAAGATAKEAGPGHRSGVHVARPRRPSSTVLPARVHALHMQSTEDAGTGTCSLSRFIPLYLALLRTSALVPPHAMCCTHSVSDTVPRTLSSWTGSAAVWQKCPADAGTESAEYDCGTSSTLRPATRPSTR